MTPGFGTEKSTVQEPLLRYAGEIGWEVVPAAEALTLRRGEGGVLFCRILEERLVALNPGLVTEENAGEIVRKIESVRPSIEGNAEVLAWLRGERSVYDPVEKRERNVTVVDYADPDRNLFQVTEEWQYTNGPETNRADVMFLVNGIPVAVVETKSASKEDGLDEALVQIREYHHETPEMLAAPQVFDITHLIGFHYGATWNLDRKNLFDWHEEEGGDFESRVKGFFRRDRFLRMLKEWVLFYVKEDELQKTILRQHQARAVERILERCADPSRRRGLIWHTQGSGKTFTMVTAARMILEDRKTFGKATVILMIDRNELEGQLSGWVARLLGEGANSEIAVEQATSKRRLKELLKADFRGLIVSMIHKFDRIPKGINMRENLFVLIDEAHRSTGGDLGNYLLAALPNATLVGFSGTPVDKTAYGKGTFKTFGTEDEKGYLDKYSIAESIRDGATLALRYALAPNEIRVPKRQLEEEFLSLAEAEGISDVEALNKILDRALNLKAFLKAPDRVAKVAAHAARHFMENVDPLGYKAFLVAVDREACALYKEALDRHFPPELSVPIYSASQHDSEKLPLVHRYQLRRDAERNARKLFKNDGVPPKILIVTDKLLTGFDAPLLYCMYLDKPMRDHVLLQAIARVNRPHEREGEKAKPCGLVVDYVGLFEKLEKALAFDSDEVSGVIEDLDLLLKRFRELMRGPAAPYLKLCRVKADDKAVERAIDAFTDAGCRKEFFRLYKQIETLYEILSPSPDLREHIEDFGRLSALYRIVRNAFRKQGTFFGEVARKTENLVRESAKSYGFDLSPPAVTIDEESLKAIKEIGSVSGAKVVNLVNGLRKTVEEEGVSQPHLRSIGERAEAILDAYDGRQVSTEEALKRIGTLIEEVLQARRDRKRSGLDDETFSLFWVLNKNGITDAERNAATLNDLFLRFPNHRDNPAELRQLKAELYKVLLSLVGKDRMVPLAEDFLRLRNS